MLPQSIELHLQIASPSLMGLPCELGIVHFTQAIYTELLKRKKKEKKKRFSTKMFPLPDLFQHNWATFLPL